MATSVSLYEFNRVYLGQTLISGNSNNYHPKHFHKNIELHLVRNGSETANINGKEYHADAGDILYIPSFYFHEFKTDESSNVIVFIPATELYNKCCSSSGEIDLPIKMEDKSYNKIVFNVVKAFLSIGETVSALTLTGFATMVFGMLTEHYKSDGSSSLRNSSTIIEILMYIDEHYAEDLTLDTLAQSIGYNKYYVSKLINSYTKMNFPNFLNSVRIQKVINLYDGKTSFESLAATCGFANICTFYRAFKHIYDKTPKQYIL